jgi:hypothetical protein
LLPAAAQSVKELQNQQKALVPHTAQVLFSLQNQLRHP